MKIKKLCLALVAVGLLIGGSAAFGEEKINAYGGSTVVPSTACNNNKVCFNEKDKYFLESILQAAGKGQIMPKKITLADGSSAYSYEKSALEQLTIASDTLKALPSNVQIFARRIFNCSIRGEEMTLTLLDKNMDVDRYYHRKTPPAGE